MMVFILEVKQWAMKHQTCSIRYPLADKDCCHLYFLCSRAFSGHTRSSKVILTLEADGTEVELASAFRLSVLKKAKLQLSQN